MFSFLLLPLFFALCLGLPAIVIGHFTKIKGWVGPLNLALLCLIGYAFHLTSSLLYRFLATPLDLGIWPYYLAHLGFVWYPYRRWKVSGQDGKAWLKHQLWQRFSGEDRAWGRLYFFGALLPFAAFWFYGIQEPESYYMDEVFRQAMASFVPLGLPLQDFLVYTDQPLHYYYIAEVLTANIAQFTGLETWQVYFHFLVFHNWLLMMIGFFALLGEKAKRHSLLLWMLFVLFFSLHGFAGPQKMSHFGFREVSLALGFLFLSIYGLKRFYWAPKSLEFVSLATLVALIAGIKTLFLFPLAIILPGAGLATWFQRRIGFVRLVFLGVFTLGAILLVYDQFVASPGGDTEVQLQLDPDHFWAKVYDDRVGQGTPPHLWIKALLSPERWIQWRPWVLPLTYSLDFFVLLLFGLLLGRPKNQKFEPIGWLCLTGGYLTMVFFGYFSFNISTSSIVYFLLFGSLAFNLGAIAVFYHRLGLWAPKLSLLLVLLIWGYGFAHYGYEYRAHFKTPKAPYIAGMPEIRGYAALKAHTDKKDYVIHNLYRRSGFFTLAALAERKSFVTYNYGESTFQESTLYNARMAEADAFFAGTNPPEWDKEFVDRYKISGIYFTFAPANPPRDLGYLGFEKVFAEDSVEVWTRKKP